MLSVYFVFGLATARGDTTEELIDKAIKASGGEAKLATLKTAQFKGKGAGFQGDKEVASFMLDGSMADHNRVHLNVDVTERGRQQQGVLVIDREKGWFKDKSRNKTEEAPKEALAPVQDILFAIRLPSMLPALKGKTYTVTPLGEGKVGVVVARKDRPDVRMQFDKESGLPAQCEVTIKEPGGREATFQLVFADYTEFGGAKHWTKLTFKKDGMRMGEIVLTAIEPKEKLEDSLFEKP
jgi:hypothetical protein